MSILPMSMLAFIKLKLNTKHVEVEMATGGLCSVAGSFVERLHMSVLRSLYFDKAKREEDDVSVASWPY